MNQAITRLKMVRQRISKACHETGRHRHEISLLAVSKRHPAEKIKQLYDLGIRSFGENQLKEARYKQGQLKDLKINWHFIGTMQSNKTRAIAEHFQWVQSVDRERVLRRLAAQRPATLDPLNICLQVNIDREAQKAGADPEEILQLAALAASLDQIKLKGLMAIPRATQNIQQQRASFRRVRQLFDDLLQAGYDLDCLSMGMSSDLETAICEGSTMVRIGTDLLGEREV